MVKRLIHRLARMADARDLRRGSRQAVAASDPSRPSPEPGSHAAPPGPAPCEGGGPWPLGTDWAWRPEPWRAPLPRPGQPLSDRRTAICDGVTLFHDGRLGELAWRQAYDPGPDAAGRFGLGLEVAGFDGAFLSLAVDLPRAAMQGLERRHILRLDMLVEVTAPLAIFARLNLRQGPNTEQILREPLRGDGRTAEFDLACTGLTDRPVEAIWLDLIFERPAMNRILLHDMTLSRRPRAEF